MPHDFATSIKWCFLVTWRLTIEIYILYDALSTGYLGFENNLSDACACSTIFTKIDTVALALWASILCKAVLETVQSNTAHIHHLTVCLQLSNMYFCPYAKEVL